MNILIFGLPGSGKTTLANKLGKIGATHLNADEVREQFQDWDFSDEVGCVKQNGWRNQKKQIRSTL